MEVPGWRWGMGRKLGLALDLEYPALGNSLVLLLF